MDSSEGILVVGASGQIGSELVMVLREEHGNDRVVATDIRAPESEGIQNGPFEILNILDNQRLKEIVDRYNIKVIFQLAALLSARAEVKHEQAWDLNMAGLFNVLNLAKERPGLKIFWPSSIAVFGPTTPSQNTPQHTICEPSTVYGISKLAGERWCEYYHKRWNVDVRSLRYPGLIGHRSLPGGGTTDYAVHIFHEALDTANYTCFLKEDTRLPMMYMDEAIRATRMIMNAPAEQIKIRSSYNISGLDFTPAELTEEIQKHIPDFNILYKPDFRQAIADSWPGSIDDTEAEKDWGWNKKIGLSDLVKIMLSEIAKKKEKTELSESVTRME